VIAYLDTSILLRVLLARSPERLIRCPAERLHAARAEVVAAG